MRRVLLLIALLALAVLLPAAPAPKSVPSWPMLGGSPARNMVNLTATELTADFPEGKTEEGELIRVLGNRIKWKSRLGSRSFPQPVVAGDKVLIGTNNGNPRNPRDRDKPTQDNPEGPPLDKGILMCFRASDGEFLWQMVHDKLETGQVNDWPHEGLCSTPTVEGDRVYYVSNRAEVVCLDLNGFANGNDGFQGEKYQDKTDGDVIWSFDMIKELQVFPHNMAMCAPLIVGELLFVVTGNGVDENHINIPSPGAPSFLCLNKKTGKLVWKNNLPGMNIMHGQWSSPAFGVIGGTPQVIFAGGDGWLYGFGLPTGQLLWLFDCNPKHAKYELGGKGTKSDFIALPVIYKEKIYIGTGQDPEHLEGVGHFWCIDPADKVGDISPELVTDASTWPPRTKANPNNGAVWHYGGSDKRPYSKRDYLFSRTMSTACIADDIVYISELAGYIQCLDARTGKKYWQWDTRSNIWGSCYFAGGKVLLANEDGDLYLFRHDKHPEVLDEIAEGSRAGMAAENKAQAAGMDKVQVRKVARDARDVAIAGVRQKVKEKYLLQVVAIAEGPGVEGVDSVRSTPAMVGDTLYISSGNTLFAVRAKVR